MTILDALLEFVSVNRLAEVGDVGGVFGFPWSGGQTDLNSSGEVFEDFSPCGVLRGASAMALVDDDQVEEVGRNTLKDFVFFIGPGEGLVETEVNLVGGVDLPVLDLGHDRAEGLEIIDQGLVSENVAVNEEERALGFARLPETPDDLEDRVGFSGPCGHDEEEALVTFGNSLDDAVDRLALVIARLLAVGVQVVRLEDEFFLRILDVPVLLVAFPDFIWRGKGIERQLAFDVLSISRSLVVRGKGVAVGTECAGEVENVGVAQRLLHAVADAKAVLLGFDDRNGNACILQQNVVRELLLFLVPGGHVAPNDHWTRGKSDFAPNLRKLIPPRTFDSGRNEEIANVAFAELVFLLLGHAAMGPG